MCIPSLIPNRLIRFTAEMWTHGSWHWPTRSARTFSSRRSRSASPRRGGTRFLQSTQTSTGLASGEHRNQRRGRSVIRGGESTWAHKSRRAGAVLRALSICHCTMAHRSCVGDVMYVCVLARAKNRMWREQTAEVRHARLVASGASCDFLAILSLIIPT
jgi:hypothetical protein